MLKGIFQEKFNCWLPLQNNFHFSTLEVIDTVTQPIKLNHDISVQRTNAKTIMIYCPTDCYHLFSRSCFLQEQAVTMLPYNKVTHVTMSPYNHVTHVTLSSMSPVSSSPRLWQSLKVASLLPDR